ncbi:MAG: hypothetical protein ACREYD_10595 [Casimicrobiaceae bacterium]
MANAFNTRDSQPASGCAPGQSRRRWAVRIAVAALVALGVAFAEVWLIEQSAATGAACGPRAVCDLVRVVDRSLAGAFAPIAILRPGAGTSNHRKAS